VVTFGKFKLYYAWVALFAACMLNIASRAARHDLFVPDGGRRHGPALGGWRGGFLFDVSGDYTGSDCRRILTTCLGIPLALALPRHQGSPSAGPKGVMQSAPAAG
jgi:hypothetical protein